MFITFSQISFAQNVKAKWRFTKSNYTLCRDCKENHTHCCVYIFNGERFIRNESYIFNAKGFVDSIYSYHVPLGVNIYSINSCSDCKFVAELKVYYNSKTKALYENGLKVENLILKDKKLIYKKDNDLIIYELK